LPHDHRIEPARGLHDGTKLMLSPGRVVHRWRRRRRSDSDDIGIFVGLEGPEAPPPPANHKIDFPKNDAW